MTSTRKMSIGVFALGAGNTIDDWRNPGAVRSSEEFARALNIARTAERGKLDFAFFADQLCGLLSGQPDLTRRLNSPIMIAGLAANTSHIGLVANVTTANDEPYNVARHFATIDKISGGRSAWNIVTGGDVEADQNHIRQAVRRDEREKIAAEFVSVVQGLWDSWEKDALLVNRNTGQYFDRSKVHVLDHKGQYFKVRGPLNVSHTPQGQPVLMRAGLSRGDEAFAAHLAEVVLTEHQDLNEAREFYVNVKRQAASVGREHDHIKIMAGLFPVVGDTDDHAQEKLSDLMKGVDAASALHVMSERYEHDMTGHPFDGPAPDLSRSHAAPSHTKFLFAKARRENCSIRDLHNKMVVGHGHVVMCGSAETIADKMEEWFAANACDGFMLTPAYFPEPLNDFIDLVVPQLQRRDLFRTEYQGATLRSHLGLPEPMNHFTGDLRKSITAAE